MQPTGRLNQANTKYLSDNGLAEVRSVDFEALMGTNGILHTKLWIVDDKHVYLGSANMCWRSLSEIKELGILYSNCPELANDIGKIFSIYWFLGGAQAKTMKPVEWQKYFPQTSINATNPMTCTFDGSPPLQLFFSSSPVEINSTHQENDLDAILKLFSDAEEYVKISVMDYLPLTTCMDEGRNYYWPALDNAIRSTAYRGLQVEMLISHWQHSHKEMIPCLKSLLQFNEAIFQSNGRISMRLFEIPKLKGQEHIDYIRVNHTKYVVTDKAAYISTSNWIGNYFTVTTGIGCVFEATKDKKISDVPVVQQLRQIFNRDWNSAYANVLLNV